MMKSKEMSTIRLCVVFVLLLLCAAPHGFAQKAQADSAYAAERYDEAAVLYDSLMRAEGQSVEALYNLGCCHYRMDNIPQAILCYERALLIEPGDEDVRQALDKARAQTIDKITPRHEIFFVTWGQQLVRTMSVDSWAKVALGSFVLMLLSLLAYLFSSRLAVKKTGFYSALALVLVCVMANLCAWRGRLGQTHRMGAVVTASSAVVRSTPVRTGTDLFILHEGTRVDIIDDTMSEWKEVELADGKKGWIEFALIERI